MMKKIILWFSFLFLYVHTAEIEGRDEKCHRGYRACVKNIVIDTGAKGLDYLSGRMMCGIAYLGCKYEPKLDCFEKCQDDGVACLESAKKFSEGIACLEDGFHCLQRHCI